jgi:hypothetical protein
MPYTYKSLAFVWLITFGLFALTASGMASGSWFLLLLLIVFATPVVILRRQPRVGMIARSRTPPRLSADAPDRSPSGPAAIDVSRWESEGGVRPPQSLVMTATEV